MKRLQPPLTFVFPLGSPSTCFARPLASLRRPRIISPPAAVNTQRPPLSAPEGLSPLQLTRLRVHLVRATREDTYAEQRNEAIYEREASSEKKLNTPEELRAARSARLRAKWNDPEWRASMLAKRRSDDVVDKMKENAKRLWKDSEYRTKMREARLGRTAWNKGISPNAVTRLRMSVNRKGVLKSEETRRRMSVAKLRRPEGDDWPKLISEGKRGKTKEYFQIRKEFRALHRDLKLWSDSYKARYGRLPSAESYDQFVAPMMLFRIRRYLILRDAIGDDAKEVNREIITRE